MRDDDPSRTGWKLYTESTHQLSKFLHKSACPNNDEVKRLTPWKFVNGNVTRLSLVYIPPLVCADLLSTPNNTDDPGNLRVILAVHGYGGQPQHEIKKWHNTATELNSIIIAPQGTHTESNGRLGWNAIDCCGDPVTNNVNDLGFLYGLMDTVLDTLLTNHKGRLEKAHVIATGFSNGGFMSSLLGLQTKRLPKLVGIVPTGGYQYDLKLYDELRKEVSPLPMMAHHGGKDSIVKPDGCCSSGNIRNLKSNCPFEIGMNEHSCTSIQTAFKKWSEINRCKSTSMNDGRSNGWYENRTLTDSQAQHVCWKGNECQARTELCIWTNMGHSWGWEFPGLNVAQSWMYEVFAEAELNLNLSISTVEGLDKYKSRVDFMTISLALFFVSFILFVFRLLRRPQLGSMKRKNSEDHAEIQLGSKGTDVTKC